MIMMHRLKRFVICGGFIAALPAIAQEPVAVSQAYTFSADTLEASPYAILNESSVSEWSQTRKITWREGETVLAISPSGVQSTLAEDAESAGKSAFAFNQGGLWRLVNSVQGEVMVGVAWSVFDDGGKLAEESSKKFWADSEVSGPNRRVFRTETIPVAFSAGQKGAAGSEATLSVVSPSGVESSYQMQDLPAQSITFSEKGVWTVSLTGAEGQQTATINAINRQLMIFLR
jgi:hypothetical protein